MAPSLTYVPKGTARSSRAPAILRAVVGPGYAVALWASGAPVAGMVHIGNEGFVGAGAEPLIRLRIEQLLSQLDDLGAGRNEMTAEIIGGADVLHIFPSSLRRTLVNDHVTLLTKILESYRIPVSRSRVGGTAGRRVQMSLPGDRVSVESISRAKDGAPKPVRLVSERSEPISIRTDEVVVNMGCLEVSRAPKRLVAVLGSCVGVALWDPQSGIGGLAHVMMPLENGQGGDAAKYADTAVPALIAAVLRAGACQKRLVAKLVGGANTLHTPVPEALPQIGRGNIEAAKKALALAGIGVAWEDTGGRQGRKMLVDLSDFRVLVKTLRFSLDVAP